MFQALEHCILKVDVTCLDIEQVLTICRQQNLHDALISIWNRAMGDYTTPINELIPLLEDYLNKGWFWFGLNFYFKIYKTALNNKLFFFLIQSIPSYY